MMDPAGKRVSDMHAKTETTHIDQLTWLRGIAAFFVIVSHTLRASEVRYTAKDTAVGDTLLRVLDLGLFGVVLFFVLSGCTLYISNADRVGRGRVAGFYIKRFFRIWPAYVISLLVYILFIPLFREFYAMPTGAWIEGQFLRDYGLSDIGKYLLLVFNITGPSGLFNNAYWSLPVEFQYYLIFPLITLMLARFGLAGPVLVGGGLFLAGKSNLVPYDRLHFFTLAYSFCGGVLIAYLYRISSIRFSPRMTLPALAACLAVASAVTNHWLPLPDVPFFSNDWNWLVSMALISVSLVLFTRFRIPLGMERFMIHYGTISYSTYLYHNLFIALSVLAIIHYGIEDADAKMWLIFLTAAIGSYFTARLSYRYIEAPSIRLGRTLERRWRNDAFLNHPRNEIIDTAHSATTPPSRDQDP